MISLNQFNLTKIKSLSWVRPVFTVSATVVLAGVSSSPAFADPPPEPMFPSVYCFRFTDIKKEAKNKYTFEFEVLNWTDRDATDLEIALNIGTSSGVTLASAGVDPNGRPIGPGDDGLPPGNQNIINDWSVTNSTSTFAQWDAGTPIVNYNLLSGVVPPWFTPPGSTNPDPESIDDGPNVRDGFTITVDNFKKGKILSFNWGLTSGGTVINNPYGSGVVSLARLGNKFPQPLFTRNGQPFNTGFAQTPNLFFNPNPEFVAEMSGNGFFAPSLDPDDNARICGTNCQVELEPRASVPEPNNINALSLLALGILGYGWKQRKQSN